MNVERILVRNGRFIDIVDLGTTYYAAPYPQPFELFTPEGELVTTGDYRGPGAIVERDGARWLLLGDPYATTWLHEYRIADEPSLTEEERTEREDFRAGFAAGADPSRKRKKRDAFYAWRKGWEEGRGAIGRTP